MKFKVLEIRQKVEEASVFEPIKKAYHTVADPIKAAAETDTGKDIIKTSDTLLRFAAAMGINTQFFSTMKHIFSGGEKDTSGNTKFMKGLKKWETKLKTPNTMTSSDNKAFLEDIGIDTSTMGATITNTTPLTPYYFLDVGTFKETLVNLAQHNAFSDDKKFKSGMNRWKASLASKSDGTGIAPTDNKTFLDNIGFVTTLSSVNDVDSPDPGTYSGNMKDFKRSFYYFAKNNAF